MSRGNAGAASTRSTARRAPPQANEKDRPRFLTSPTSSVTEPNEKRTKLADGLWQEVRATPDGEARSSRASLSVAESIFQVDLAMFEESNERRGMEEMPSTTRATGSRSLKIAARRRRQRATATRLLAASTGGASLGQGLLADSSVQENTLADYVRRLGDFWAYVEEHELNSSTAEDCDQALTQYSNHLYAEGELTAEGEKLRAAWEASFPEFSRHGNQKLPRLRRALRGWARLAPTRPRYPVPEEAVDVITLKLLQRGRRDQALWVQIALSTYLRPGEMMGLKVGDLIPPMNGGPQEARSWSLFIAPFERETLTKTRGFDEAITLGDPRAPWLGRALEKLQQKRRTELRRRRLRPQEIDEEPMWPFAYQCLREHLLEAVRSLNLMWLIDSPYAFRHAGASRDVLMKLREMNGVQRRGRWAALSSLKHYEKHGRVQWLMHKLGSALLAQGRQARNFFEKRFLVG